MNYLGDNFHKNKTYPTSKDEICWWTKGTSKHSKKPSPKSLPNVQMKVKLKEVSWCWKSKSEGKKQIK